MTSRKHRFANFGGGISAFAKEDVRMLSIGAEDAQNRLQLIEVTHSRQPRQIVVGTNAAGHMAHEPLLTVGTIYINSDNQAHTSLPFRRMTSALIDQHAVDYISVSSKLLIDRLE